MANDFIKIDGVVTTTVSPEEKTSWNEKYDNQTELTVNYSSTGSGEKKNNTRSP